MPEVEERLDKVEKRLTSVETSVQELRGEVDGLRGEVGGLRGEVGELRGEVGELRGEVQALRVLGENNAREIKLIAEVQDRHSAKLDEIGKALEPLVEIRDFVRLVAHDPEHRLQELERRTSVRE